METIPVNETVEAAVIYCIEHDILRSFLLKNRAEVVDVCIFEYNEELLISLSSSGRQDDINRAISDPAYRKKLYLQLCIDTADKKEV